jgi:coniferyl-aldehyde dehydrogenase
MSLTTDDTPALPGPQGDPIAEARRLFALQHAASRAEPAPDLARRLADLDKLAGLLARHGDELATAISADFGTRARQETELLELVPTLSAIRHAKGHLGRWMRPERRRVSPLFWPGKAWVQYQPLGVIGIIAPWNYPLNLTLTPLVDALAAGNRVLVKPSEYTPAFSAALKRRLGEVFPEAQVAVALGGAEVAAAFSHLPFDHLLFTGSTEVGRKVMLAAAEHLTPVTLELGGKSPVIVCDDYGLERAAKDIAFGKWVNAGQTCIAPDYVLAPAAQAEALATAIVAQVARQYPTVADNPQYSSIITDRHHARLVSAVEEARAAGARVLSHGEASSAAARKINPTVVLDPPLDGRLMREEIFGPVLPIVGYRTLEEAIAFVNARERPLALYCLSRSASQRDRVLARTVSGNATVNGTLLHIAQEDLPFGGVGPSGIGAYHGREGFKRFSHARGVFEVRGVNPFDWLAPPYGKLADTLVKAIRRL